MKIKRARISDLEGNVWSPSYATFSASEHGRACLPRPQLHYPISSATFCPQMAPLSAIGVQLSLRSPLPHLGHSYLLFSSPEPLWPQKLYLCLLSVCSNVNLEIRTPLNTSILYLEQPFCTTPQTQHSLTLRLLFISPEPFTIIWKIHISIEQCTFCHSLFIAISL